MFIKVLIVFAVEQTIEGRFVSPLVLGSHNVHPITILFVLLTGLCLESGEFSLEFQFMHRQGGDRATLNGIRSSVAARKNTMK